MKPLKSIILLISRPALEIIKDDNWKLSSFFGFFFALMAFIVMLEYSSIWAKLMIFFFAFLAGSCLGTTAIVIDRTDDD